MPATRTSAVVAVAVGVWAVGCAGWLRIPYEGRIGPAGIADERGVYIRQNASEHPLHHTFAAHPRNKRYGELVRAAARSGAPTLFLGTGSYPANSPSVTGVFTVLGFNGSVVPLNGAALDSIGLAYPLAAHSERITGSRVGHDKRLPDEWIVADRAAPHTLPHGMNPALVNAARRALHCGPLAELRAATRDPLTPGRFWHNITGVWQRTAFRFPNDPVLAEHQLCGTR